MNNIRISKNSIPLTLNSDDSTFKRKDTAESNLEVSRKKICQYFPHAKIFYTYYDYLEHPMP